MSALRFAGPIALGVLVLLMAGCTTTYQVPPLPPIPSTYSPELLTEVLRSKSVDFVMGVHDSYVMRSAIELGDEAIPSLLEAQSNATDEEARRVACIALAYVGGPKAVEALRNHYLKTGELEVLAELCFALGTTGSPTDRQYLLETLERYLRVEGILAYDWSWRHLYSSALHALGVLREQQAIPALEESVRRQSIESFETYQVIRSIKHGEWSVPMLDNCTERDEVILAVLRSGLENTLDALTIHLHEVDSNRSWLRSPDGWDVSYQDDNPDRMPRVRFDVFISSDGQRALCETSQTFGPLASVGYDYVLRRDAGEWKVVGMRMTWIS